VLVGSVAGSSGVFGKGFTKANAGIIIAKKFQYRREIYGTIYIQFGKL